MPTNLSIRQTTATDLPRLREIFDRARQFMLHTGNPHQWIAGYPNDELLQKDMESGDSYVVVQDTHIVGTFVLRGGDDPTYEIIYDGAWLNDEPYATIHRIASSGEVKGIFQLALEFAREHYNNLRIDTHRDNRVMQQAILQQGFHYCGIIHCWNGSERLAYQYSF